MALQKHSEWRGKLDIALRAPIENDEDLAIAYTPGVAEPCLEIRKDEDLAYEYTGKGNLVAVITDGTAVLGLGDIGPSAAMPVMEGKCALFKRFGNVNAIPLCVDTKDVDEIVETVYRISKSFGGINLVNEEWLNNPWSEVASLGAYILLIIWLVKASMHIKK